MMLCSKHATSPQRRPLGSRSPQPFTRSSVALSLIVVACALISVCSAGTVPNRANRPATVANTADKGKTHRMADPAFANAGRAKGMEVWRIENFHPVAVPAKDFGKFYTGDSYIVLNTKESQKKVLSWDVHFWLGLETSQDEAGAAAIHTVHLDDQLNGAPVQYREVQEHESELFLSYFKNGIRYAAGGVASGFSHVETNAAGGKRLFQVKGKRNVRVREVALTVASMNKGDCFLLDTGSKIIVYVGPNSKRVEKLKAISAANQIRDQDHRGRATVEILDEFSTDGDRQEFFDELGSGSPSEVPDESEDDETYERQDKATLYLVSDATGTLKVTEVATTPLTQDMLKADDCFILDAKTVIFVWVGRKATKAEKDKSMQNAQEFITTKHYPKWTAVRRIVQDAESAPFKQYFTTWRDYGASHSRLIRAANDNDSETGEDEEFDPAVLHALQKSGGRALQFMPDNGEGESEIYRVENFALVPVESDMKGMFFGGDSYVVKYEYHNKRGGSGVLVYNWQGKKSSIDEKAASAMLAVELGRNAGHAVQIRVTQGNEPRHFLKLFQGTMIVFTGGHASGFKNIQNEDTYEDNGVRLFRVRGTNNDDVQALQLTAQASSLASDDSFVLETPEATYIWNGQGSSSFERNAVAEVAARVSPSHEAIVVDESSEPAEFWDALGGQGAYDTTLDPTSKPFLDPRLFHCSIRYNGRLRVEEVGQFEQEDLNVDDIMVLDGGDEVYIWVGSGSTEEEKEKAEQMATMYIRTEPSERSEETVSFIQVEQGYEPRSFKRLFPAWDDELWETMLSYEEVRNNVLEANKLVNFDDAE